jgi:hypothetical protein
MANISIGQVSKADLEAANSDGDYPAAVAWWEMTIAKIEVRSVQCCVNQK